MSIPIVPFARTNPVDRSQKLFYPKATFYAEVEQKKMFDDIANAASVTRGDILNVFDNLPVVFQRYLSLGMSVKIDGLGIFKPFVRGTPSPTAKDVTTKDITSQGINFIAARALMEEAKKWDYVLL